MHLRRNPKAYKRYKTARLQMLRLQFLRANPLCANHYSHGAYGECREFATEVDHIVRCETNKDVMFYDTFSPTGTYVCILEVQTWLKMQWKEK